MDEAPNSPLENTVTDQPAPKRKNALAAVDCPHCAQTLKVPLEAAGRRARCTCCKQPFQIPNRRRLIDATMAFLMTDRDYDPAQERERWAA